MNSFNDFGLAEPIIRALAQEQYITPTPIQSDAIPLVLSGRDIVGIAQTGTGKTAAFALPILNRLAANRRRSKEGLPRAGALARRANCPARSSTASAPTDATSASRARSSSAACRWAARCAT